MIDNTPRWTKIGDALSQLLNVALLPRHKETTANESISGRAHRCGWRSEALPPRLPVRQFMPELREELGL